MIAKPGDTAESLAAKYLGRPDLAWMIEDYMNASSFSKDEHVAIPRRYWNPPGVFPSGYQVVPVLVYHNISPAEKGQLVTSPDSFAAQMRYLKQEGYHVIPFEYYLAYLQQNRQLPRRSVVLTFDDAHRGFAQHAYPVLSELEFRATMFVAVDQVSPRPNAPTLTWSELRDLALKGLQVQAHSKSHGDLRRGSGETEPVYARRMQRELAVPMEQVKIRFPRTGNAVEAIAYPMGLWNEELLGYVKQHGYGVGFTMQPESNPAFVPLLAVGRISVQGDWTLDRFKKALKTFQSQQILPETARTPPAIAKSSAADREQSPRERLAAPHNARSEELEARGQLYQALEERKIALTIDPDSRLANERREKLESRMDAEVAARVQEGTKLAGSSPQESRRQLLAALALNPFSRQAFNGLRGTKFLSHTVRRGETTASLADLYYGDGSRADLIEQENNLVPGAPLAVGSIVRIPEIPGRPFLRPDRPDR